MTDKKRPHLSSSSGADRRPRKASKKQPLVLRIMTFNVQAYRSARKTDAKCLMPTILQRADIVALQEDLPVPKAPYPSTHAVVASCRAEKTPAGHLMNKILVAKRFRPTVEALAVKVNVTAGCTVPRCATCIRVDGRIVIANVHLCGGRFDDPHYKRLQNTKALALQNLLDAVHPDIIVGDFNGEQSTDAATKTLQNYPLFRNLKPTEKVEFLQYFQSAHRLLEQSGYEPAFIEAGLQPTNKFGGVSDWVYIRRSLKATVRSVTVINALACSDHNAVLVELVL